VTDVVADPAPDADAIASDAASPPVYAWAPPEPTEPRRRRGVWIGVGVATAVLAGATAAASLVLIAPGTSIGGVSVGGMTAGAAADALTTRVAATAVDVVTPTGTVTLTGLELGATIDARALAESAYARAPLWNLTAWNSDPVPARIVVDPATADAALRRALPAAFSAPVDAAVVFDADASAYTVTPSQPGSGVDAAAVTRALQDAFDAGAPAGSVRADLVPVAPAVDDAAAADAAARLNGMLDVAGFYIGDERTVALDRATVASWLRVGERDGAITLSADASAIQGFVSGLPALVDRAPVAETVVTNSAGTVLDVAAPGVMGRSVGDTSGIGDAFAARLAAGDASYPLTVQETPFTTTTLARTIEVDLSAQTTTLFENGQTVATYAISSGKAGTETPTGRFEVFAHVRIQDMGCTPTAGYCTTDVPWVTYFAPDIGFHGAYWHNNFGTPMSHGCVNMPISVAQFVYGWAPEGTEVWVHD
jgi:lipoprotein-anchoring transpeptidase ErfK/SrfK